MSNKALVPRKILNIKGKLSYSESLGAWNTLRFKKEIVREFPQLAEKRSKFAYKLIQIRDFKEFVEYIKKIENSDDLPMLLWLEKEEY